MRLIGRIDGVSFYRMTDGRIKVVCLGANWGLRHFVLFAVGMLLTFTALIGGLVGLLAIIFNWQTGLLVVGSSVLLFYIANIPLSAGIIGSGNISSILKWCQRNQDNPGAVMLYQSLKAYQNRDGK